MSEEVRVQKETFDASKEVEQLRAGNPAIGAVVYLVLEELLSQVTEYWALIMGPLLLMIVLFGRGGIMGLLGRFDRG